MSNKTVCSQAPHWPRQRTPLHPNRRTLWMTPSACVYIERYKHFPLQHWDGVGEEICIFTTSRARRMVTLSGNRITFNFRVACKSAQVYAPSEKEGLRSRKAAAHLWCPSPCRVPGRTRHDQGDIASCSIAAGHTSGSSLRGDHAVGSSDTGSKRGSYGRRGAPKNSKCPPAAGADQWPRWRERL